ncbi:hypothetical protein IGI04_012643 [Brassica rapa subsp. trilocularis]|uniref:Uncharacterized protein n=1 Tax=Brassica rapa subsp. trilocularis TaxID=1813537 RepID=A0ABQ7N6I1_BRACM|nr:hypothetical protein IGI04_012643 [Brassica rapa subsp. trilocularis]
MALKRTGGDRVKLGSVRFLERIIELKGYRFKQSCGSLFRSAVEFQTTVLPPAKRQRIITMNVPWSSYNFRIESLTQKLLIGVICCVDHQYLISIDIISNQKKSQSGSKILTTLSVATRLSSSWTWKLIG